MADRTRADARYGAALDAMAISLVLGLMARESEAEVWRPLAVASADNDLAAVLAAIPPIVAAAGPLESFSPALRTQPSYTVAREIVFVCDVAADLGLLVRSGAIERA